MDSGNSGSIQSSSGGDDDYDSRAADSSFSNPSSTTATATTTNNPLLFSQSSTMFDPLSNYFDPLIPTRPPSHPQHNTSILNLDMPSWSKSQTNPFFTTQTPMSFPQISEAIATTTAAAAAAAGNNQVMMQQQQQDQSSQSQVGARNPKKRSRASRRAPTTVLTTDTSNFRAMVQEFTGIPAPPFTSSPFPRTRLDLFTSPTPSSFRSQPSNFNHNHHLLRPFPQKFQTQVSPFSTTNTTVISSAAATTTCSPSDQSGLLKPPQSSTNNYLLNNMQMQNLTFQSFLQPSSSNDHQFGLTSHNQLNANNPSTHISNVVSPSRNREDDGSGYNFSGSASSNLNFSGGKAVADNVSASGSTTRGEGLMESWICSSD